MLTRQRHLLDLVASDDHFAHFHQPEEEGETIFRSWIVRREDWDDLGNPEHITLTVEPGDLLNEPADE